MFFCSQKTSYSVFTPYSGPSLKDSVSIAGHVNLPQLCCQTLLIEPERGLLVKDDLLISSPGHLQFGCRNSAQCLRSLKCDAFYGPSETEIGCLQKGKERLDAQKDAREEMGGKCANGGGKGGGGAGKGD